jgi:hypothetical protein
MLRRFYHAYQTSPHDIAAKLMLRFGIWSEHPIDDVRSHRDLSLDGVYQMNLKLNLLMMVTLTLIPTT